MDLHDFLNVRRVYRMMAAQWGCPVWMIKWVIRRAIDDSWKRTLYDPEAKKLWDTYFPAGKPTPSQYILRLGYAYEKDEDVPYLLKG